MSRCARPRRPAILRAMSTLSDVAIIGGGPAGSAAAILLAGKGRSVVLCERENFPRFKIGESLLPHSMALLRRLGVHDALERHAFPKVGGEIATACGTRVQRFYFDGAMQLDHRSAFQVERAWFDKLLLDRARSAGVDVRQPCEVRAVRFDAGSVTLDTTGGEIRARYLLDCSGRNAVVGSQFDLRRRYEHLQKFSVFAHFEGVQRDPGRDASLTRLVRARDGWFWLIPIDERRTSIGLVTDITNFRAAKRTPEAALDAAVAASAVMRSRMSAARRVTDVHSAGDYSYRNTRLAGPRWLLAGDAAGFIDPIFSTGVFLALHSAELAAKSLDSAIRHPLLAPWHFRTYARRVNRVMDRYLRFVNAWYQREFIDIFTMPRPPLRIPQAVNSVLGGNIHPSFSVWWRLHLFYLVLWVQKRHPIVPRFRDDTADSPQPVPDEATASISPTTT